MSFMVRLLLRSYVLFSCSSDSLHSSSDDCIAHLFTSALYSLGLCWSEQLYVDCLTQRETNRSVPVSLLAQWHEML
jgi:hypothetical protein